MAAVNTLQLVVNEFFQALGVWLVTPMKVITFFGDELFYILLLPILYWSFDQMIGLRVGMMLLLSNGINAFFKFIFRLPRPTWISDTVVAHVHESSFGLPSGHAQNAISVWGRLAVEVKKRWFTFLMVVLILLIGISRLVMGVHFLGDLLAGWLIGGLLLWAFSSWFDKIARWLKPKPLGVKIGLAVASTAVLMLMVLTVYWAIGTTWEMDLNWVDRAVQVDSACAKQSAQPELECIVLVKPFSLDGTFTFGGTWTELLVGFLILWEKKGRFLAGEGGWHRLARFLVGLVGVIILYFGLGQVFPRGAHALGYSLRFIRYTLVALWVSWIAPLAFEKIGILKFEGR
ncbi:MAG: phosphatase PAP2 family protein [Chloroflexi bacterium]|nr:phosphatase PAP2 family protein [Chloroflexota bacterium]